MVDDVKQGGEELDTAPYIAKGPLAAREEEILAFWNREGIFEKSLQKPAPKGDFVFYDGPPFATGLPHYGHLLQSTIKDAVPRYRTMTGWRVPRRWGWDCPDCRSKIKLSKNSDLKPSATSSSMG